MPDDRICGLNAVAALFARRLDDVNRLFYADPLKADVGLFCAAMARRRLPYRLLPPDELERVAGTVHHGGIVALANPRPIPRFDPADPPRHKLLLALDGIGNPHNLGAIARSAAFFGVPALILHDTADQAFPSDAAYRVAEGGLEQLDLFLTPDLPGMLKAVEPFYRTAAATLAPDAIPLGSLPRDRPVMLVLGNEEYGLLPEVEAACRRRIRITPLGPVQSLNVAQTAAILLHDLSR
ncbi:MAG: RNA methyltransferase [Acetobacteraceae bacterium]|nr:RNA methyltransferase [Acetobacteraceae bacterium]